MQGMSNPILSLAFGLLAVWIRIPNWPWSLSHVDAGRLPRRTDLGHPPSWLSPQKPPASAPSCACLWKAWEGASADWSVLFTIICLGPPWPLGISSRSCKPTSSACSPIQYRPCRAMR